MIFVPGTKPCENKRKKIYLFIYSMKRMESCPHIKHFVLKHSHSSSLNIWTFKPRMSKRNANQHLQMQPNKTQPKS